MRSPHQFGCVAALLTLLEFSTVLFVSAVLPAPLPEGGSPSSGVVPQPRNCSTARPDEPNCLPAGPSGSIRSGPPLLPPVRPPFLPPPSRPGPEEGWDSFPYVGGWAQASLHIEDDGQDVTYESDRVWLLFMKRADQDTPGKTDYVLAPAPTGHGSEFAPLSMTWRAKGRMSACTVEGEATVTFPIDTDPVSGHGIIPGLNTAIDPLGPAYGYLFVIGPDGGDYHSVMVSAFNPDARLIKTCPGNPPTVTKVGFGAGFLLHIVWRKNMYDDGHVFLTGMQVFDAGKPDAFLDLLPPGPARDIAAQALSQAQPSSSPTSRRYIWEWTLWPFARFEGIGP